VDEPIFNPRSGAIHIPRKFFSSAQGESVLFHEILHAIFQYDLTHDQDIAIYVSGTFKKVVASKNSQEIFKLFTEGTYTGAKNAGHPYSNATEFMSSVFSVIRYFPKEFHNRVNNTQDQELKAEVLDIMS